MRVLDGPRAGLSAARNTSLKAAQGRWAAILDSDDVLHRRHIERLVEQAQARSAQIVAANMVSFRADADRLSCWLFADGGIWTQPHRIGLTDYVRANNAAGDAVSAGYLKPLFDMAFLRSHAVQYDVRLRIAEDYDLVARLMDRGASFEYLPEPTYFYRRHSASTSHRHGVTDLSAMLALADNLNASAQDDALRMAIAARTDGIRAALRHARAIEGLKARQPLRVARALGADPAAWKMLASSCLEGAAKRLAFPAALSSAKAPPQALVIGDPSGDAALLAQIEQLKRDGIGVELRAAPVDSRARAKLADGAALGAQVLCAQGISPDDAAFAWIARQAMPAPNPDVLLQAA